MKKTTELTLQGKRILIRVDFNVPLDEYGDIVDTTRIDHALPLIKHVIEQGGTPVLIAHLGRPNGVPVKELTLKPIQIYLQVLFSHPIALVDPTNALQVETAVTKAREENGIVLLENIRFWKGEEDNDPAFAQQLASYGDIFINEAFSASHRNHASIVGVPGYIQERAMGFLFEKELNELTHFLEGSTTPEVIILGGAKIETKIGMIRRLMHRADTFLVGGALANTFLAAQGYRLGDTYDERQLELARTILQEMQAAHKTLHLPVDAVVEMPDATTREVDIRALTTSMKLYDIGAETVKLFMKEIQGAKTVIWNGPLGYVEKEPFRMGSKSVLEAVGSSTAETLLGGGDTVTTLDMLHISIDTFSYVSLSGGAMIEFMEHMTLPGIVALGKHS